MPKLNAYTDLMARLEVDIKAAWPTVQKIYRGSPFLPPKHFPYVVITLDPDDPVKQTLDGGVKAAWQQPNVFITKVEVLPSDKTVGVQDRQISDANALIGLLETSTTYAGVVQDPWAGVGPIPSPGDDKDEVFSVTVLFTCRVREFHTSFTP